MQRTVSGVVGGFIRLDDASRGRDLPRLINRHPDFDTRMKKVIRGGKNGRTVYRMWNEERDTFDQLRALNLNRQVGGQQASEFGKGNHSLYITEHSFYDEREFSTKEASSFWRNRR